MSTEGYLATELCDPDLHELDLRRAITTRALEEAGYPLEDLLTKLDACQADLTPFSEVRILESVLEGYLLTGEGEVLEDPA